MRVESSAGNTERNSDAACSGCEKTYLNKASCGLDTGRSLPSRLATAQATEPGLLLLVAGSPSRLLTKASALGQRVLTVPFELRLLLAAKPDALSAVGRIFMPRLA